MIFTLHKPLYLLLHERLFLRHNMKVINGVNFSIALVCSALETERTI